MATFEELFSSSNLEVVVPPTSLDLPALGEDVDQWYAGLSSDPGERDTAFFDEKLESVLLLRCNHPLPDEPKDVLHPPVELLAFVSHLQVDLEASYISSVSTSSTPSTTTQLSAPPRTASLNRLKPRPPNLHPSIFPPQTPRPTPYTGEADRRYVSAEGAPLATLVWGENAPEDTREAFSLCWSRKERLWIAMYRIVVGVVFLRIPFLEPLLCLTVSVTLRDKLADPSPARRALQSLLRDAGGLPLNSKTPISSSEEAEEHRPDPMGLEEVNLLEGLSLGPTFGLPPESRVYLPSSRLGATTRRTDFAIASPSFAPSLAASPPTASHKANQTMRKSFRKTLLTASGFRVRMRTVFAPYVLLSAAGARSSTQERLAAGGTESTVVLSVELENTGEASAGFAVERVLVKVGGEGARASLVSWYAEDPEAVFPVRIAPSEQCNLLYAVSFQRPPDAEDFVGAPRVSGELQRAVTIDIHGRPYEIPVPPTTETHAESYAYPTRTFSSRWNCVLDLAPNSNKESRQFFPDDPTSAHDALPEPASPFPTGLPQGPTSTIGTFALAQQADRAARAVAGSRRHTPSMLTPSGLQGTPIFAASPSPISSGGARTGPRPPTNYRTPASALNPATARERELEASLSRRAGSALPPSLALQAYTPRRAQTTYAPPVSPPLPSLPPPASSGSLDFGAGMGIGWAGATGIPQTPAYPAFPASPGPPTPRAQVPLASQHAGVVGPSVEIRRERGLETQGFGSGGRNTLVPPTPGPRVMAGPAGELSLGERRMGPSAVGGEEGGTGEYEEGGGVIVSIGLLDRADDDNVDVGKKDEYGRIYPLHRFTLDVFVFNRSAWTRRFEVSYPDRRRRRQERARGERHSGYFGVGAGGAGVKEAEKTPGIVPLENRVRVGPLRPSTCQSVRMDFLAMAPGVHSIDALTLTDVESGYAVNLRSVMDVVVHEPWQR